MVLRGQYNSTQMATRQPHIGLTTCRGRRVVVAGNRNERRQRLARVPVLPRVLVLTLTTHATPQQSSPNRKAALKDKIAGASQSWQRTLRSASEPTRKGNTHSHTRTYTHTRTRVSLSLLLSLAGQWRRQLPSASVVCVRCTILTFRSLPMHPMTL